MKAAEATKIMTQLQDILERHVGIPLTPELATGIHAMVNQNVCGMVEQEAQAKKPRKPATKKSA